MPDNTPTELIERPFALYELPDPPDWEKRARTTAWVLADLILLGVLVLVAVFDWRFVW